MTARLTSLISSLAPWLAPIPTAYVVAMACLAGLGWPPEIAFIAAVIIETISLATTDTALTLFAYNRGKRKTDPAAPAWVAWGLTVAVILAQSALILALEAQPVLLLFQVFSSAAIFNLALRADHSARIDAIAAENAERAQERAQKRAERAQSPQVIMLETQAPAQLTQGPVNGAQAAVVAAATLAHKCGTCGAAYAKQTSLAAHMRSHAHAKNG